MSVSKCHAFVEQTISKDKCKFMIRFKGSVEWLLKDLYFIKFLFCCGFFYHNENMSVTKRVCMYMFIYIFIYIYVIGWKNLSQIISKLSVQWCPW